MKTAKIHARKTLSVFLAVLMVMSAWVFIAPSKAQAATAGNYFVKITWKVENTGSSIKPYTGVNSFNTEIDTNNNGGISLFYKTNNGTGTEHEIWWDVANENCATSGSNVVNNGKHYCNSEEGTYTLSATIPGFPTRVFACLDYNNSFTDCTYSISKIEVGASSSSPLTAIWSGEAYLSSSTLQKYVNIYPESENGNDNFYGYVNTNSPRTWEMPVATSISSFSISQTDITVPTSGSTEITAEMGLVKDQYGVDWYEEPYAVPCRKKVLYFPLTENIYASSRNTITVTSDAMSTGYPWKVTYYAVAKVESASITSLAVEPFKVENPKYNVTWSWKETNTEDLDSLTLKTSTTSAYYNQTPTAPSDIPNSYYTSTQHFKNGTFTPTAITGEATFNMEYATVGDHEFVLTSTTHATCTADGSSSYKCSECEMTKTETIPAKGHTPVTDPAVAPTCTELGKTEGSHCSECNTVLTEQQDVPMIDHTYVAIGEAKDATCTETGITAGSKCSVCGKVFEEQQVIDALGHKEETIPAVAPTCTKTGLTAGVKCSVCGEIIKAQDEVPMLAHKPAAKVENIIHATCENAGSYDEVQFCSECQKELSRTQITIQPTSHTDKDNDGNCDVCGTNLNANIPSDDNCLCHKAENNGFYNFIYKIVRFFWKLFGTNKVCECGTVHY